MITWEKGRPLAVIDLCLIIYMNDYEFARWDGKKWHICYGDDGGYRWVEAQEAIEYYSRLNRPE